MIYNISYSDISILSFQREVVQAKFGEAERGGCKSQQSGARCQYSGSRDGQKDGILGDVTDPSCQSESEQEG